VLDSSYRELVDFIVGNGARVPSRYGDTLEVTGASLEFEAGALVSRKGINHALGYMELLQLIAGVYDLNAIARVAPKADLSLFTPQMAYGPRVVDQIPTLIQALKDNPLTRQAVLYIGKPEDGPTPSQPCTTAIQFILRDETLFASVSMRSWDVFKGFPYDIMMFGGLVMAMARCLDVLPGSIAASASSLHAYVADLSRTPKDCNLYFEFDDSAPRTWNGFRLWALNEIAAAPGWWRGWPHHIIEYHRAPEAE
jgi:hypothetical protein